MGKKKTYHSVLNEILGDLKNAKESQWEELYSLSKKFHHFHEGYLFTKGEFPEWSKKFFKGMLKSADAFSDWFWTANHADLNSPEWLKAVEKAMEKARDPGNILYRWKRMRSILPDGHPHRTEAENMISSLQKKRKKRKTAR